VSKENSESKKSELAGGGISGEPGHLMIGWIIILASKARGTFSFSLSTHTETVYHVVVCHPVVSKAATRSSKHHPHHQMLP
jgi:hypothetical protein